MVRSKTDEMASSIQRMAQKWKNKEKIKQKQKRTKVQTVQTITVTSIERRDFTTIFRIKKKSAVIL